MFLVRYYLSVFDGIYIIITQIALVLLSESPRQNSKRHVQDSWKQTLYPDHSGDVAWDESLEFEVGFLRTLILSGLETGTNSRYFH